MFRALLACAALICLSGTVPGDAASQVVRDGPAALECGAHPVASLHARQHDVMPDRRDLAVADDCGIPRGPAVRTRIAPRPGRGRTLGLSPRHVAMTLQSQRTRLQL